MADRSRAPLGTVFPSVAELVVDLEFISPDGHILSTETRTFSPDDALDLSAPCPGRCGNGTMDLAGKVDNVVRNNLPQSEGSARCPMALFAGSTDTCGTQLHCRISVSYS